MDSKNPRRDVYELDTDDTDTRGTIRSRATTSTDQRLSRQAEAAFVYQSAQFATDAEAASGVQHARAVMYPEEEAFNAPLDDEPVIVPVLGIQPVTQPLPRDRDHSLDNLAYPWPDDQDTDEDDDAPDSEPANEPDEEPELDIPEYISDQVFLRDDAFALRERSWEGWRRFRRTALILLTLTLMLAVAIFGAAVAASYLLRATDHITISQATPTISSYSNGVVVQPGAEATAPTPEASKYQIGAWLSNNAPSGGSVKVFVRLSEDVGPIPQIPVTLEVQMPGGGMTKLGPTNTDAYGLVVFTVDFGGASGAPIFVTASATVGTQNLTAETVFVPI